MSDARRSQTLESLKRRLGVRDYRQAAETFMQKYDAFMREARFAEAANLAFFIRSACRHGEIPFLSPSRVLPANNELRERKLRITINIEEMTRPDH
jgi:hypothetical protein